MKETLISQFEIELMDLIEKYSGMEMTSAQAIGVLEFQKHRILLSAFEDDEE